MNIAILIPTLGMGGAERAAVHVGSYYHDRGHQVYYFLLANCGQVFFPAKGKIVKTHVFYPFLSKSYPENIREMLFAAKTFKKLKQQYQIDVAISFMEACNYINVCSRGKEKVFVSVRTVLSERTECSGFVYDKRWIRRLYRRADKVIAVSNYVKNDLVERYGISDKKIVAIPNVSARPRPLQTKSLPWEYGDKAIVCVGRMDPVKRQERIIRAFSYVYEKQPQAKLIIAGDGKQKNYLTAISQKMGLEKGVVFVGAAVDVGYFLQHARAFVMASRVEGFPNAMVEAMAYGVPIITADSPGGCGEIVGKEKSSDEIQYCEYGILTPRIEGKVSEQKQLSKQEELLGMGMLKLLEDHTLYQEYSEKAKKRAGDYSEENIMALWDALAGGH
ncbi:MAG: glycosyltransferase [Lachnospiraceae bacterium]|nr:glycosyltransferase [Lachnospiraceae bacterium]